MLKTGICVLNLDEHAASMSKAVAQQLVICLKGQSVNVAACQSAQRAGRNAQLKVKATATVWAHSGPSYSILRHEKAQNLRSALQQMDIFVPISGLDALYDLRSGCTWGSFSAPADDTCPQSMSELTANAGSGAHKAQCLRDHVVEACLLPQPTQSQDAMIIMQEYFKLVRQTSRDANYTSQGASMPEHFPPEYIPSDPGGLHTYATLLRTADAFARLCHRTEVLPEHAIGAIILTEHSSLVKNGFSPSGVSLPSLDPPGSNEAKSHCWTEEGLEEMYANFRSAIS
jgi:hypothetical protein